MSDVEVWCTSGCLEWMLLALPVNLWTTFWEAMHLLLGPGVISPSLRNFFEVLAARSLWVQWCARLEVWVFSCSLCCAWHRLSCPQARLPDWLAWVQGLVFVRKAQEVLRPWMGIRLSMARWDWIQEATCLCRRECACQVRWAVESSFGCTLHHPCLHPWWCGRMWCSPSSPVYPGKDKSFILSYFLECNTVLLIYCSFHLIFLSNG